jgi:hypothetical protein
LEEPQQSEKEEGIAKGTPSMLEPLILVFARDHGYDAFDPTFGPRPEPRPQEFKTLVVAYWDSQRVLHDIGRIELQELPEKRTLITFWKTSRFGKLPPQEDQRKFENFRDKLIDRLIQLGFVKLPPSPKKHLGFNKGSE